MEDFIIATKGRGRYELHSVSKEQGYILDKKTGKKSPIHKIVSILAKGVWTLV